MTLFSRFVVKINEQHLQAHLWSAEIKPAKHCPAVEYATEDFVQTTDEEVRALLAHAPQEHGGETQ